MRVILDSISLHDNPHAAGEPYELLADAAAEGAVDVAVPEVVIQEAVKHFGERLTKAKRTIEATTREINQLTTGFVTQLLPNAVNRGCTRTT